MGWRDRGRRRRRTAEEKASQGTVRERSAVRRILHGRPGDNGAGYDPDHHPQHMVDWFMAEYRKIGEPERVLTRNEDVKYVQKPERLPTFARYAIESGIRRETLWYWRDSHTEFGEAYETCKDVQEAAMIQLAGHGAITPAFATLMMKNLQGWQEKVEQTHLGGVKIVVDRDDEDA